MELVHLPANLKGSCGQGAVKLTQKLIKFQSSKMPHI